MKAPLTKVQYALEKKTSAGKLNMIREKNNFVKCTFRLNVQIRILNI